MKIEARNAQMADLTKLIELTNDTIERNYKPFMSDEGVKFILKSKFYDGYLRERIEHIRVVEVNDQTCGFLISRENQVELLMVDSDIHGYGAGTHLLRDFEGSIGNSYRQVFCKIHSGNKKALGFFTNRGFKVDSKEFDPIAKQDIVTISKTLKE